MMEEFSALKMEAATSSELPVRIYQTMRRYSPQDNNLILVVRFIQMPLRHT
jgi:hypothetical protein